jgi:hypothetical protein
MAAIAVLDPSADGAASVAFAACLCRELTQRGGAAGVALASFQLSAPLEPALRAAFAPDQTVRTLPVQASEGELAALLAGHRLWLLIGPGSLAFAAPLLVMVGAEAPVLRWPDVLRERRERISLALSGDGLSVAKALAPLLAGS